MSRQSRPYYANQRDRWLRHDAHLWIRHDVKRFLKPGTDPADVHPALARQRDREDAAFKAEIERGYRLIATLRKEVASIRADMLRRRQAEQIKYSLTQPRVPPAIRAAGNGRIAAGAERAVEALAASEVGMARGVRKARAAKKTLGVQAVRKVQLAKGSLIRE
jgi:hypothetical protein